LPVERLRRRRVAGVELPIGGKGEGLGDDRVIAEPAGETERLLEHRRRLIEAAEQSERIAAKGEGLDVPRAGVAEAAKISSASSMAANAAA
jgi:hypothetical protein